MKALTKSYIAALEKLVTHGSIVVENYANDKPTSCADCEQSARLLASLVFAPM